MNILVVDDEKNIAYAIAQILEEQKWQVTMAYDGQEGLDLALSGYYDVAILDIMLPGMNGFEIVQKMRANKVETPTLLLSALDEIPDKVKGLNVGADDYMTKPFEIRELLMRIQAISRRSHHQDTSHPVVGNLSYDPATCEICNTQTKKSVQVSGKEMQLLEFFMNNCNQILEKNQITTKIWGFDSNAEYNNVEVYVSFLRRKFHHLQVNVTIRAIRGIGYIMEVSDD